MLAQMQNSVNNVNQILAITVRTIFHIVDHSNHEGMTTARQKINMRNDCVTSLLSGYKSNKINWLLISPKSLSESDV